MVLLGPVFDHALESAAAVPAEYMPGAVEKKRNRQAGAQDHVGV